MLLVDAKSLSRSNMLNRTNILPPTVAPPTRPLSILQSIRAARRNVLELIPELAYNQPIGVGAHGCALAYGAGSGGASPRPSR
jgi:hypothetical protein